MMKSKIVGPKSLVSPLSPVWSLVQLCSVYGLYAKNLGDTVEIDGVSDREQFTPETVKFLIDHECEVYRYPMFFEVTDLDATIPGSVEGISGLKWKDLEFGGTFSWSEVNGKFYRGTEMPPSGEHLKATDWLSLQDAGATLVASIPAQEK